MKTFVAFIPTMTGGSWCRDETIDKAVDRCVQIFKEDWGSLFDFDGRDVTAYVCDSTGRQIGMSPDRGFWDAETGEQLDIIEERVVTI